MGNKFIDTIKKKWLKSIVLTILLFGIIIAAYIIVSYTVSNENLTDIDFTQDRIYSISQSTKDKLKNLEDEITITVFNMYDYVEDFAYKYDAFSDKITAVLLEDINQKPEWKEEYGFTNDSIFVMVSSESRNKLLWQQNLITYDFTTGTQMDVTEEAITNAILDVTTNVKPKLYFTTGHNLYIDSAFMHFEETLISEVNEVKFIDLRTEEKVPEDCNVLVITALAEDMTQKESEYIIDYIKKGGKLLMLLDPNLGKVKMPNFQKVLDEYGVSLSEGFLIEGDSTRSLFNDPSFVVSPINNYSQIVKNISMALNVCMINPAKLTFLETEELEKKNVTLETLATTSSDAFYRTNLSLTSATKTEDDEEAPGATIAAMLTKEIEKGKNSKLIIFGNTAFATNIQTYSDYAILDYNNKDILLNSISYLTEREDNITIRKSSELITTYNLTEFQAKLILGIIFTIPGIIVILGIIVWILRRRKK